MKRFRNILYVAEPGGQSGFDKAVAVAEENQANLTAVLVLDEIVSPWEETIVSKAGAWLDGLVATAGGRVAVEAKLLRGSTPFLEVIREVMRHDRDLVIKPVTPEQGIRERLLGSADMHLLRKCPVPVWLIRPDKQGGPRRVVAAVDFGSSEAATPDQTSLNRQIMELSVSVAMAEFAELHLCHVWDAFAEGMLRTWANDMAGEQVARYVDRERRWHEAQVDSLLRDCEAWVGREALDYVGPTVHLRRGLARDVIPELAHELEADLVVMGTVARTGVPGLIIGNTAESVLNRLETSVLAVKPAGFVSPVSPMAASDTPSGPGRGSG